MAADTQLGTFFFFTSRPTPHMMRKRMFTDLYRITMWKNRPTAI